MFWNISARWIAVLLFLSVASCRVTTTSKVKGDEPGQTQEPMPENFRIGMLKPVLTEIVGEDLDGEKNPELARCAQSCHVHKNIKSTKLGPWFKAMQDTIKACRVVELTENSEPDPVPAGGDSQPVVQQTPEQALVARAKAVASCLDEKIMDSGMLRAVAASGNLRYIWEMAEIPDQYNAFKEQGMPPPDAEQGPMPEEAAWSAMYMWSYYGGVTSNEAILTADIKSLLVNEGGSGPPPPPLANCQESISDEYKAHIKSLSKIGWTAKNANDPTFRSFACKYDNDGGYDVLGCFNDKDYRDATGKPLFPELKDVLSSASAVKNAKVRLLKDIGTDATSYWMRVSADGRYTAIGGRGFERLQQLIDGQGPDHLSINAPYDPGFFPGNQGFVFQAGGMLVCNQKILEDAKILEIGGIDSTKPTQDEVSPEKKYCSTTGNVSLYQSVGTSLSGDDYFFLAGNNWEGDPGSIPQELPVDAFANPESTTALHLSQSLGTDGAFTYQNGFNITTPYQGDWFIVPSGTHMIGREATQGRSPSHNGYVIRRLVPTYTGEGSAREITAVNADQVARICMNGRKPVQSLDERFLATHNSPRSYDYKAWGFASAQDPEFVKLIGNSTDLFLIDLLTGQQVKVTSVGPNRRALFPHFRSDGWLYFMVKDDQGNSKYMVTDAALRMGAPSPAKAKPTRQRGH